MAGLIHDPEIIYKLNGGFFRWLKRLWEEKKK